MNHIEIQILKRTSRLKDTKSQKGVTMDTNRNGAKGDGGNEYPVRLKRPSGKRPKILSLSPLILSQMATHRRISREVRFEQLVSGHDKSMDSSFDVIRRANHSKWDCLDGRLAIELLNGYIDKVYEPPRGLGSAAEVHAGSKSGQGKESFYTTENPTKERGSYPITENSLKEKGSCQTTENLHKEMGSCHNVENQPKEKGTCDKIENPPEEKRGFLISENLPKGRASCPSVEKLSVENGSCHMTENTHKERENYLSTENPLIEKGSCPTKESPPKEMGTCPTIEKLRSFGPRARRMLGEQLDKVSTTAVYESSFSDCSQSNAALVSSSGAMNSDIQDTETNSDENARVTECALDVFSEEPSSLKAKQTDSIFQKESDIWGTSSSLKAQLTTMETASKAFLLGRTKAHLGISSMSGNDKCSLPTIDTSDDIYISRPNSARDVLDGSNHRKLCDHHLTLSEGRVYTNLRGRLRPPSVGGGSTPEGGSARSLVWRSPRLNLTPRPGSSMSTPRPQWFYRGRRIRRGNIKVREDLTWIYNHFTYMCRSLCVYKYMYM